MRKRKQLLKFPAMAAFLVLVPAGLVCLMLPVGLFSQTSPPTGLKALSATLDRETHDVSIQLQNVYDRVAVAYMLRTKELDAYGQEIGDPNYSGVGFDWAGPGPNPNTFRFILPGQIVVITPYRASAGAVSVEVFVTGVIYANRTFEGLAGWCFATRGEKAKSTRQALELLRLYPATRGEMKERMKALLSINAAHVSSVVANSLHLPAIPDTDHAPEVVSKQQWEEIKAELGRQATWYETESQPQGAKQLQGAKQ